MHSFPHLAPWEKRWVAKGALLASCAPAVPGIPERGRKAPVNAGVNPRALGGDRKHSCRRKSRRPQSHGLPDSSPERTSKTLATGYPKWLGQTPQAAPFNQLAIIVKATRFTFFGSPRLRYRAVANGFSSVAVAAVMDA